MIGTHSDQDHINGLIEILSRNEILVDEIWINPTTTENSTYQKLIGASRDIDVYHVWAGLPIELDPSINAHIISPPEILIEAATNARLQNSNSLVIKLEYDEITFLFTGDSTDTTVDWLVDNQHTFDSLDVDIMNGLHHGSKYGNSELLIEETTPKLVVFSANKDNHHKHPDRETILRYESFAIPWVQTGIHGDVTIVTNGVDCTIMLNNTEDERPCYDETEIVDEFSYSYLVLLTGIIPWFLHHYTQRRKNDF